MIYSISETNWSINYLVALALHTGDIINQGVCWY